MSQADAQTGPQPASLERNLKPRGSKPEISDPQAETDKNNEEAKRRHAQVAQRVPLAETGSDSNCCTRFILRVDCASFAEVQKRRLQQNGALLQARVCVQSCGDKGELCADLVLFCEPQIEFSARVESAKNELLASDASANANAVANKTNEGCANVARCLPFKSRSFDGCIVENLLCVGRGSPTQQTVAVASSKQTSKHKHRCKSSRRKSQAELRGEFSAKSSAENKAETSKPRMQHKEQEMAKIEQRLRVVSGDARILLMRELSRVLRVGGKFGSSLRFSARRCFAPSSVLCLWRLLGRRAQNANARLPKLATQRKELSATRLPPASRANQSQARASQAASAEC